MIILYWNIYINKFIFSIIELNDVQRLSLTANIATFMEAVTGICLETTKKEAVIMH